ncbi:MAG: hypothetical protein GVY07_11035 [Bacteroidetes bacterium]|jgi:hypothetical protein|nr:hypothetical protein [Bacteroidota bacterium]
MELETMKTIWKKESEQHFQNNKIEQQKIQSLMNSKSQMTFAMIKRSLQFKSRTAGIIGTGALILAAFYFFGVIEEPLFVAPFLGVTETGVILFLMGLILCVTALANLLSYNRVKQFEQSSKSLKQMLSESVIILRNIIYLGIYSDAIFVPVLSVFIAYKWLFDAGLVWDIRLLYLVLIVSGAAILSYTIASRFMYQKHGGNLERLQGYLKELESGNSKPGHAGSPGDSL